MNGTKEKILQIRKFVLRSFVCVFLGLLLVVVILSFHHSDESYPDYSCINVLRQIDAAASWFASDHGKTNGSPINFPDDLTPYIKLTKDGKIPPCPKGGVYSIKKVGDIPTCSLGTNITPPHVMP